MRPGRGLLLLAQSGSHASGSASPRWTPDTCASCLQPFCFAPTSLLLLNALSAAERPRGRTPAICRSRFPHLLFLLFSTLLLLLNDPAGGPRVPVGAASHLSCFYQTSIVLPNGRPHRWTLAICRSRCPPVVLLFSTTCVLTLPTALQVDPGYLSQPLPTCPAFIVI